MHKFPSRFRRLDEILGDLPVEEPLLLTELDGYLTGIAVCPVAIAPEAWLPPIWGGGLGESPPFEDPIDVRLFADMVIARYHEILRDLGRGRLQPIFDVDERNGDVLWELWVEGLFMAAQLEPAAWAVLAGSEDAQVAAAFASLDTLGAVASEESALTSMEINRLCDEAPGLIAAALPLLYTAAAEQRDAASGPGARAVKVGRNEPCPCGSGKKHKRCCGAD